MKVICLFTPIAILLLVITYYGGSKKHQISSVAKSAEPDDRASPPPTTLHIQENLKHSKLKNPQEFVRESIAKRDAFMKREAGMWPDELKQASVNATLKRIEAEITPMMGSFQIDSATSVKVLDVFQHLEAVSLEIYLDSLKDGMNGISNQVKKQDAQTEQANRRLEALVGSERAKALLMARKDALKRMSEEGIKNANLRAAD